MLCELLISFCIIFSQSIITVNMNLTVCLLIFVLISLADKVWTIHIWCSQIPVWHYLPPKLNTVLYQKLISRSRPNDRRDVIVYVTRMPSRLVMLEHNILEDVCTFASCRLPEKYTCRGNRIWREIRKNGGENCRMFCYFRTTFVFSKQITIF